jgi:hypothetical protein
MIIRIATFILLLLLSSASHAHQDVEIQIMPDGKLLGLPKQYQPASLEVAFSGNDRSRRPSSIVLSVGNRTTTVPRCVAQIINTTDNEQIGASASWYHTRSTLPPYLNVIFLDPGQDTSSWPNSGFSLLFNLETSKLIRMEISVARKEERSMQSLAVDLSQSCGAAELTDFYQPLPARP